MKYPEPFYSRSASGRFAGWMAAAWLLSSACPGQTGSPAQAESRGVSVRDNQTSALPKPVSIPRSYALVVGISQYAKLPQDLQLQFSTRDAESIYSILISPEGGNYHAENVHRLLDGQATFENIRRELEEWLPAAAQPDDRVLIYFAGHGFISGAQAYLAPADFDPANPSETGYNMKTLSEIVGRRIQAKSKILLTDACHSGAITPETDVSTLNRRLSEVDQSIFSLTASRDRESSLESSLLDGGHGVFTYFVVQGLTGEADESCDGVVTADELAEYVRTNVRKYSKGRQTPTSDRASFDPEMLVAYNPTRVCSAPAPLKFGTFIIEANLDGVEVFLDSEPVGVVKIGSRLTLPGLKPGVHSIKGVKLGYEPDGPREELLSPGENRLISINILVRAHRKQSAVDRFDKGFRLYQEGYRANYLNAIGFFKKGLAEDPGYSRCAMYLARTYDALFEPEQAKRWYEKALEIDPDYQEARSSYAGLLLDMGALDAAVRQLTRVLQREPGNALANSMMAQAMGRKELFAAAAQYASKAIQLAATDAEPHFWLAESLRLSARSDRAKLQEARQEYLAYLNLSNFESGVAGKLNYYVLGYLIGAGKKKHAAQEDIWKDLRSIAYAGMGDCERLLDEVDAAIGSYQRSLFYDKSDPLVHFALALEFIRKFEKTANAGVLLAARDHLKTMLSLNGDLDESQRARRYLAQIDTRIDSALARR